MLEVIFHVTGLYPAWWNGYRYSHAIRAWVVSNSLQSVRDVLQLQYYLKFIHPSFIADKVLGRGVADLVDTLYIKHINGGVSTISFKSSEQGREKLQGEQVHLIHADEEQPMAIYTECLMRTVKTSADFHGMVILSMTPLKGLTDMILHFTEERREVEGHETVTVKRPPETTTNSKYYITASWDDNPHLPDSEKKILLSSLQPYEIEARTKGVPYLGSGLVYAVPESMITCFPFEIPKHWGRFFALDFGWVHPTAALFFAIDRDTNTLYVYGEYCVSELAPQIHATRLIKMGANWIPGVYDYAGENKSQADGGNLVTLYREAGLKSLTRAKKDRELGVQTVLQRMQNGQLKIFTTCVKLLSELRMYARDEKGSLPKIKDDLLDCLRYGIMSGLPIAIPENFKDSRWKGKYGTGYVQTYI